MNKINKYFSAVLILCASMLLQSCGSPGEIQDNFFLVTNTNSGHVCVEYLVGKTDPPDAQTEDDAAALYSYFGYKGGDQKIYSGPVPCSRAKEISGYEPDVVVSLQEYFQVIYAAYFDRKYR